jgi:nicotinamide riboside kinase
VKIALSGTESTGKSTLANAVGEKTGIPVIAEYAREVAKEMGVEDIRAMAPDQAYRFQYRILDQKIEAESKHETFIADRSTADNAAYYLRWVAPEMPDSINQEYIGRCVEQLKIYDHVVLIPWNSLPVVDDGFRSANLYYLYEIHCLIRGFLEDNGISYTTLDPPALGDRVMAIEKIMVSENSR